MSLMNKNEVLLLLKQLKVNPNKKLGQNFLTDKNIVKKIISISEISKDDILLEIGPGLGALTEELATKVKKIYAIEIDPRLYSYLKQKFSIYNNLEIIHGNVLELEIPFHNKVISNIPYSITGPIFEKIFFKKQASIGVLIIEKSIADRIFLSSDYKNISRISIGVNTFMKPVSKSNISRNSFYPIPKIALSLIKIFPKENLHPFLLEKGSIDFFLKFIAGIMPYKNKNIANALNLYFRTLNNIQYTKEEILTILHKNDYKNNKLFSFKIEEFIEISKLFFS
ncbi:MAG: ribosomal RNA small subunit methyltransferase A [Promethearchaeota archaeon]|nr:MAG: ribosomal RNA small subunit methyltransferase A [Candidatus Lokiarchaeota archaeon]